MDDRRKFERKTYTHPVNFSDGKHLHHGMIDNISNGGVFILTRRSLGNGTRVVLCIELPDDRAVLEGEVIRETASGLGVRFIEADIFNDLTAGLT